MSDADWHTWRAQGLGASDIAKAWTGIYGGRYKVVADKLGLATDDIDPALAKRGHDWEQPIADAVHAIHGYYVHGEQLLLTSPHNDRWRATIDGLLDRQPETTLDAAEAVLEIKTAGQHVKAPWDYYEAQVNWQMHVAHKQRALIALAVFGVNPDGDQMVTDVKFRWVERNDHLIAELANLANELWDMVEAKHLPDPDETTDVNDVKKVNALANPEAPGPDIDNLDVTIAEYEETRAEIKRLNAIKDECEATIRHAIGEAKEASTSDGRWRVRVGEPIQRFTNLSEDAALLTHPDYGVLKLDRARFKAELPGEYDDLKVPTPDRRLTIKENPKT